MLCHEKYEVHVKILCYILIEKCPGLKNPIKVVGSDCEKSILNESCITFPSGILLLCTKHAEVQSMLMCAEFCLPCYQRKRRKKYWLIYSELRWLKVLSTPWI